MKSVAFTRPNSPLQTQDHSPSRGAQVILLSALALGLTSFAHAQENTATPAKDPFVAQAGVGPSSAGSSASAQHGGNRSQTLSLTYEVFSLPIVEAANLNRRGLSDPEIYRELISTAKLERLQVLRSRSMQRSQARNNLEHRYPTDFFPPSPPEPQKSQTEETDPKTKPQNSDGPAPQKKASIASPPPLGPAQLNPLPRAWDTRLVGDDLVFSATASENENEVALELMVEHTVHLTNAQFGTGILQPEFGSLRMETVFETEIGHPRLVGTLDPWFAKSPSPSPEISRREQHVWFCFVTTRLEKPLGRQDSPSGKGRSPR